MSSDATQATAQKSQTLHKLGIQQALTSPQQHGDLWQFVSEIAGEDRELRRLWSRANSLHQNFYEGWMPPEDVRYAVEDVKQFVERLKRML